MQANFRMVMRSGPTVGKVYPLEKSEIFVGRDLSNDIVINDPEISRRHARLYVQGASYVLEDLGSTNGTFVNGQRLMGANVLRPGDSVTFGERMNLVFEAADYDQDATLASPSTRTAYEPQGPAQIYAPQPAYPPAEPAYPPAGSQAQPRRVESYAGQVPAAYAPEAPAERRLPVVWIVVIAVLLLTCLCLAIAAWNAPQEFWCLFPVWPEGYCP
jgi:predicted component of type VI protein secretion system